MRVIIFNDLFSFFILLKIEGGNTSRPVLPKLNKRCPSNDARPSECVNLIPQLDGACPCFDGNHSACIEQGLWPSEQMQIQD